ncbi:MAG: leucine-rich repeat domain-containing protein [Prevotella sp.]|nr:leucine-rich repeat domain-containing protein [Prevotella sp.]
MKKLILSFIIIFIPLCACSVEIGNFKFNITTSSLTAELYMYNGNSSEVVIPEEIEYNGYKYTVTSISGYKNRQYFGAFQNNHRLKSITFPKTLKDIGPSAFGNCDSLTHITFPQNLINIGNSAFSGCENLSQIVFGNNIYQIGEFAFYGCNSLSSIILPKVKIIGYGCFQECRNLKSIILSDNLELIPNLCFYKCEKLNTIIIPNSVTSIGKDAFDGCSSLSTITIGKNVTKIGESPFTYCSNLKDVYCYAETVPNTDETAFNKSISENATLHVPETSINSYRSKAPWKSFGKIVALSDEDKPVVPDTPEVKVCATPTISYENGKLIFNCETEGAVCKSTITDDDVASFEANEVQLNVTYNISVYATKEGYKDSEVAKATLCWIDVEPKSEGLTNTDIANVKALPVVVQANNGTITVSGADDGTMVEVYGISGTKLGEAKTALNTATIHTDAQVGSVVIVKVGNKSIKIAL